MSSIQEEENPSSIYDESLYNIRHESNRIFIQTYKSEILYHRNPNPTPNSLREVKVIFHLSHQVVPDDLPRIDNSDGVTLYAIDQHFAQPLTVLGSYEKARPAFHVMLLNFRVPFEFRAQFGEIHWGYGFLRENDPIQGFDGVVDRIAEAGVRAVRQVLEEAANKRGVLKSVSIKVRVLKRTVVEAERYRVLMRGDEDNEGGGERFEEAVKVLETTSFNGADGFLECSICLNEVVVGTQVAKLPCSHKFHKDCIVSWLKKSQTCPLCRLMLVKPAVDHHPRTINNPDELTCSRLVTVLFFLIFLSLLLCLMFTHRS